MSDSFECVRRREGKPCPLRLWLDPAGPPGLGSLLPPPGDCGEGTPKTTRYEVDCRPQTATESSDEANVAAVSYQLTLTGDVTGKVRRFQPIGVEHDHLRPDGQPPGSDPTQQVLPSGRHAPQDGAGGRRGPGVPEPQQRPVFLPGVRRLESGFPPVRRSLHRRGRLPRRERVVRLRAGAELRGGSGQILQPCERTGHHVQPGPGARDPGRDDPERQHRGDQQEQHPRAAQRPGQDG